MCDKSNPSVKVLTIYLTSHSNRFRGSVTLNLLEAGRATFWFLRMTKHSSLRYFKTSFEVIRLAVMIYVRFSLSLRNVEDLLHERGIDVSLTQAATAARRN